MTKIEMGKQYRTRDGREVRIYAVDGGEGHTDIHGAIKRCNDEWCAQTWWENGKASLHRDYPEDLIEVKRRIKRDVWLNVYEEEHIAICYLTKELADKSSRFRRIACVKITIDCEEGEGL